MKAEIVHIQPEIDLDRLAAEARKLNIEISDGERIAEQLPARRLRLGKILVEARKGFSRRGDGFVKWVEDQGIAFRTAHDYMRAAGYVPEKEPGAGGSKQSIHGDLRHESREQHPGLGFTPVPEGLPSNIERLISEGIHPREAALQVVNDDSFDWSLELERLAVNMSKAARSLFNNAEALDVLCRQKGAIVVGAALDPTHAMLVAAEGSIKNAIRLMGGSAK